MDINPYAPAPIPEERHADILPADRPLPFSGTVEFADVARLGRRKFLQAFVSVVLIFGLFTSVILVLGTIVGLARQGIDSVTVVTVLLISAVIPCLLIGGPLFLLASARGRGFARRLLRTNPRLLGPVEGQLGDDSFEVVTSDVRSKVPYASLTGVRLTQDEIVLAIDVQQRRLVLLPRRLFEDVDFEAARDRLRELAEERPWKPLEGTWSDTRFAEGEPLELFEAATSGIAYYGTVYTSDITQTGVYREQVRRARKALFRLIVILLVVMTALGLYVARGSLIYWLLVWPLPFAVIAVGWLLAARRTKSGGDQPIAVFSGQLAEDLLTVNSPLGSTIYRRSAFAEPAMEEGILILRLHGDTDQIVIVTESMFSSADDFRHVCRWAGVGE